jgi:hypothetical protein
MKSLLVTAAAAGLLIFALPGESLAQPAVTASHGGKYDPHTVWTVSGEVISVDQVASGKSGFNGVHLLLHTVKGDFSVHLGPSWFVDRQPLQLAPHDMIEVTGSPVVYDGKPALIAAKVTKGGQSLLLRTAAGLPLWRGSVAR